MRYLGLDLGSRTLGCALSDKSGIFARSYTIIRHNEEYDRLIKDVYGIVTLEKVEAIVLGYPKNMNNNTTAIIIKSTIIPILSPPFIT